MIIESLHIPDKIEIDGSSKSKIFLMEEIIKLFLPLFHEEIDKKERLFREASQDRTNLKKTVASLASHLKSLDLKVKKEQEKLNLLTEIESIIEQDLMYGSCKQFVKKVLSELDSFSVVDLEERGNILRKMVLKNVKKVIN